MIGYLDDVDAFGLSIPSFNLKGKDKVTTRLGGLCSLLVFGTVILFAVLKLMHLVTRHNPQLSEFWRDIDPDTVINLKKSNTKIAFSIETFFEPQEFKMDPKYVKWIFSSITHVDNERTH